MPESPHHETLVLLQAAQAGSADATDKLLARYRDRVLQIVSLSMSRRRSELLDLEEDIVQETLLEAFQGLAGFEPKSDGAFLHWMARLAENNIRDAIRRERAMKRGEGRVRPMAALSSSFLVSSIYPGKEPTPSQVAYGRELVEQVEAALIALPDRHRKTFVMRKLCGLSFDEIASELGLGAVSSARSLYSRILADLSAQLPDPVSQ